MITDPCVLEETHVPRDLQHRNAELNHFSQALQPVLDGHSPAPTFCFGPSGAGKTVSAKFALRQLRQEAPDVVTHYVNCWQAYRRGDFLEALFDGLGDFRAQAHRSMPTADLLTRLQRALDGRRYAVILDEADVLEDGDTVRQVANVPEVVPIFVANREEELFARLDDGYETGLRSGTRIQFSKYGVDAIVAILSDRTRLGLAPQAVDTDLLHYLADQAAGDARLAIQTLRVAAEQAMADGRTQLSTDAVDEALPRARQQIKRRAFSSLDADLQVLVKIIAEADGGEIQPSVLYREFRDRVDNPPSDRQVRNFLTDLEHYNLVLKEGATSNRVYRLDEDLRVALFERTESVGAS